MSLRRRGKCLSILLARWRWIAEPWRKQTWKTLENLENVENLGGSKRGKQSPPRNLGFQSAHGTSCSKLASFNHSHPNSAECRGVGVSPGNGLLLVVPADPTRHTWTKWFSLVLRLLNSKYDIKTPRAPVGCRIFDLSYERELLRSTSDWVSYAGNVSAVDPPGIGWSKGFKGMNKQTIEANLPALAPVVQVRWEFLADRIVQLLIFGLMSKF